MPDKIYQIKVTLLDTKPLIWRRIAVPGNATLAKLHKIIQVAMGWRDCHLHEFRYKDIVYGVPDPESGGVDIIDERKVRLNRIMERTGQEFVYIYDFGDEWRHHLYVEEILEPEPDIKYPVCLGGERACPPEDCGGPYGYEDFLAAIGDPDHEEHETMSEWIGGEFDADAFDLEETNEILKTEFRFKTVK